MKHCRAGDRFPQRTSAAGSGAASLPYPISTQLPSNNAPMRACRRGACGLLQVRGRYVPKVGNPVEERAFLFWCQADDSGNLKGFLRKAGRKFDKNAVIWKGNDPDATLFTLKEWPALGLGIGSKKNLGSFRSNRIGYFHALVGRGHSGLGEWEDLGVWTMPSFFSRQPRRVFV
jgi:hypothetical protein